MTTPSYSEEQIEQLLRLCAQGKTVNEIAMMMGRKIQSVVAMVRVLLATRRLDESPRGSVYSPDASTGGGVQIKQPWPPTEDGWTAKVDFGAHDVKLKKAARVVNGDQLRPRSGSEYGCATRWCSNGV